MNYDWAMETAQSYPVRRMSWREGWQVAKEGGRLVYKTTAQQAKPVGWVPTQLDKDATDWVHVSRPPAPQAKKGKRK